MKVARERNKPSPYVIGEQRVALVYQWMKDGVPRAGVIQLVAKSAEEERAKLADAERARAVLVSSGDAEGAARVPMPVRVWAADDGQAISTRTIDAYIRKAKERFQQEHAELSEDRQWAAGQQMSRLNSLLNKAIVAKQLNVALEVVKEQNKILNLHPRNDVNLSVNTIKLGELSALFSNMSVVVSEEVTDPVVLAAIEARWSSLFRQAFGEDAIPVDANDITAYAAQRAATQPRITSGDS